MQYCYYNKVTFWWTCHCCNTQQTSWWTCNFVVTANVLMSMSPCRNTQQTSWLTCNIAVTTNVLVNMPPFWNTQQTSLWTCRFAETHNKLYDELVNLLKRTNCYLAGVLSPVNKLDDERMTWLKHTINLKMNV